MVIATVVVVATFRHHEIDEHVERVEAENARLAGVFSNIFFKELSPFILRLSAMEPEMIRQRGELRALDVALRALTAASPVLKAKIYDTGGRIIYSPVRADIGDTSNSPPDLNIALAGHTASDLSFRKSFMGWDGPVTDRYLVTSYVPLRRADNTVGGVFELCTDVTAETEDLHSTMVSVASIMVMIFLGLYCVIFLVVRRAHRILVTQRRDLEASRAEHTEQEEMLRRLIDAVGEGIVGIDGNGIVTFVNPAAVRLTGWGAGELVGRQMHEMIHHTKADGSQFPPTECLVQDTLAEGTVREVTGEVFWRKDGTSLPVEYTATPIHRHGAVTGSVTVFRDVGDRLKVEEAVRRERDFTKAIIDSLPGLFYSITSDGRFDLWNRNFETITGYDADEISGMHPLDLFQGEDKELIRRKMTRVFTEGTASTDAMLVTKDGRSLPYFFTGQRLATGDDVELVGMAIDISLRKKLEEALVRSNQRLNTFAYAASHDLQEPLRMVVSYLQLLKKNYGGQLDADADEFIGYAVDGARRMKRLIDDLLTYSRVSTRNVPFASIDMAEAVVTALANLKIAIRESGAVVTVDPLPTLNGDATQIERLLQNLIGNAVKYRLAGTKPAIHVAAVRKGDEWQFSVADNGIGIGEEHFDRVFDIFQRLHGREEYEGSGVGLAVCKQIIEHHGGRIWLESVPGEGSTFFFTLPDRFTAI